MYQRVGSSILKSFDKIKGRQAAACRQSLERSQWFTRGQLDELRLVKLKALLKHAYEGVPHYHRSFRKAGFKPDDFQGFSDLCRVPVLTRAELRDHASELVAQNFPRGSLVEWTTSGTTAAPVKFLRDKLDVSWGIGAELRGYGWAGYKVGHKVARIWSHESEQVERLSFRLKTFFKREKLLNLRFLSEGKMGSFASEMQTFQPDFVRGYGTGTSVFGAFLLKNPSFKINPKAVFTTAASLLPHYRRTIERAFGCRVYDYYACAEVSHVAAQCGESRGLHVSEENVLLETVAGVDSVADGEDGKILVTNLNGYGMPFIRYDVGDAGRFLSDDCSCGRKLRLMELMGRNYEYFLNSDGSFSSLRDLQTVFENVPIKDFQVVQETYDDIVVKVVPDLGYSPEHTDFLLNHLKSKGPARVRVELIDQIPMGKSGKIVRVVSKFGEDYGYFGREPPDE